MAVVVVDALHLRDVPLHGEQRRHHDREPRARELSYLAVLPARHARRRDPDLPRRDHPQRRLDGRSPRACSTWSRSSSRVRSAPSPATPRLFWLARRFSPKVTHQVDLAAPEREGGPGARASSTPSAPVLIVAGRYVPGLRFVVNATMGLSDIRYRRFVAWSVASGCSGAPTPVSSPTRSVRLSGNSRWRPSIISGLVTTVGLSVVLLSVRRRRRMTPRPPTTPWTAGPAVEEGCSAERGEI